ncbi:hypothetical protein CYMTET_3703 [Cymbomonas tetramitiformis]|uniref:Cyclic nucleotide-binding domain-containing protein n=1 Tax=Cymbomonas tetramitiformis TaxID=36881 RepID=A0AAE0H2U5_9CHLO|nr:hypothetical protein CYMTET_3703 [Cymbomonas tetramitiformis]
MVRVDGPDSRVLGYKGEGDFFGEEAFLVVKTGTAERRATVVATSPCTLLSLDHSTLDSIHRDNPTTALKIYLRLGELAVAKMLNSLPPDEDEQVFQVGAVLPSSPLLENIVEADGQAAQELKLKDKAPIECPTVPPTDQSKASSCKLAAQTPPNPHHNPAARPASGSHRSPDSSPESSASRTVARTFSAAVSVTANINDTSSPATPTSPSRRRSAGWEDGVDDVERRQRRGRAFSPGSDRGSSARAGGNETKDNGRNASPANERSDIDRARRTKTPEAQTGGGAQAAVVEDVAYSQGGRNLGHHFRLRNAARGAHGIVSQSALPSAGMTLDIQIDKTWWTPAAMEQVLQFPQTRESLLHEESFNDYMHKSGRHTAVSAMGEQSANGDAGWTGRVSRIVVDSLHSYVSMPNMSHRGSQRDYSTSLLDEDTLYKQPMAAEDTLYDQAGVRRPGSGQGFLEANISTGEVVSSKQPCTPPWQAQPQQEPQTSSRFSSMGGSPSALRTAHREMLSRASPRRKRPSPRTPELPGVHLHDPLMNSSRGRLQGWAAKLAQAQGILQGAGMEDAAVDVSGMYTLMTPGAEGGARNQFPERNRRRLVEELGEKSNREIAARMIRAVHDPVANANHDLRPKSPACVQKWLTKREQQRKRDATLGAANEEELIQIRRLRRSLDDIPSPVMRPMQPLTAAIPDAVMGLLPLVPWELQSLVASNLPKSNFRVV